MVMLRRSRWNALSIRLIIAAATAAGLTSPAAAQFKEGVEAGYGELRRHADQLKYQMEELDRLLGISNEAERLEKLRAYNYRAVVETARGVASTTARMKSGFDRLGAKLHEVQKDWGSQQRSLLQEVCASVMSHAARLEDLADDSNPRPGAIRDQIENLRGNFTVLHERIVEVGRNFESQKETNRRTIEERQAQLSATMNEMRSMAAEVKRAREELEEQYETQQDAVRRAEPFSAKLRDLEQQMDAAVTRLAAGEARNDPPLSPSDLDGLQANVAKAVADYTTAKQEYSKVCDEVQAVYDKCYPKIRPFAVVVEKYADLTRRRDTLGDELRKWHHILYDFKQEYTGLPSL